MRSFSRQMPALLAGAALMAVVLISTGVLAQDAPTQADAPVTVAGVLAQNNLLHYQGQIFNPTGGRPLANQTISVRFRFYSDTNGGGLLWEEFQTLVTTHDGLINAELGKGSALPFVIFDGRDLFLGVAINGEEGRPLLPVTYTPYAIFARNADKLDGIGSGGFMKTVAYGIVDENGNRVRGSGFSSSVDVNNVYFISVDGVSYHLNDYVTMVTPITQSACPKPTIAGTNSNDGKLLVELFSSNGSRVRCKFHFVVGVP